MKIIFVNCFIILAFCFNTNAYSQPLNQKQLTKKLSNEASIAAVVNESSILKSELDARVRLVMISSGIKNSPEVKAQMNEQILKLMIDEVLQSQITALFEIKPSAEEIETSFQNMEERNGMAKGELNQFLKAHQIPRSVLLNQIKAGVAWHRYIQERYQPLIQINDKDVAKVLDHLEMSKAQQQVLLAEIVLPFDTTDEHKVRNQALHLAEQLRHGANFSMIAQQFSHSASASRGGDIGWMPINQLEKPIQKIVRIMDPGNVSQVIKMQNAYHIVMLRNRREAGSFGAKETVITFQQALFPFPSNASQMERETVFRKATSVSQNAKSQGMFEKLVGDIPSTHFKSLNKVPLTDLSPQLRDLLVKLPLNRATPPIESNEGVFVFFISDKQTISPEAPSKDEVYRNLMEQKLSLIAQRELRNLRRTAFINIRL
ncbi:MAG: peptidylprolyl isomerase [Alphaproteobacteria bacterium]|nr:peptidylprolyl isomerase [Alphaproteobacteria bacterium]